MSFIKTCIESVHRTIAHTPNESYFYVHSHCDSIWDSSLDPVNRTNTSIMQHFWHKGCYIDLLKYLETYAIVAYPPSRKFSALPRHNHWGISIHVNSSLIVITQPLFKSNISRANGTYLRLALSILHSSETVINYTRSSGNPILRARLRTIREICQRLFVY